MRKMKQKLIAALLCAGTLSASPILVNTLELSGAALDQSGGTNGNTGRVGYFSDIYYDNVRNEWWALSDRGPGGGTISYDTRVQRFTVDINNTTGQISNFNVAQTVKFTDGAGNAFNGLAPNPTDVLGRSFDPEGLVIDPTSGHLFVSDEYGPSVYEFNRNGTLVRTFTTPANLIPRNGANTPNFASDVGNTAGKSSNRGFEGLAISPDGKFVYATLQSAMRDENTGAATAVRIVKFDMATGNAVAQYAYQMEASSQGRGLSALVAVNDHEFLVLERNNRGVGVASTLATGNKKIYRIDIASATDVTNVDLDSGAPFTPVSKNPTVFLDLATGVAALGGKIPEKLEGVAIGPRLLDGTYVILTGTDNDYSVTQGGGNVQFDVYFRMTDADPYASSIQCPLDTTTNCFFTANNNPATLTADYKLLPGLLYAYKSSVGDLSTYLSPTAVPEPSTFVSGALGLAALAFARLRRRA
jgi:hypothetical protein